MNFMHLFWGNVIAGSAAVVDQVAGTGIVQSLGPWGMIAYAFVNVFAHAAVNATQGSVAK